MSTFSDLPRYPTESTGGNDQLPDSEDAVRQAFTIAQVAGELLFVASPIIGILWLVVSLPVLLVLIVAAVECDKSSARD